MTEKPISYMPTREQSDIFCHWLGDVDKLIKLLKIKAFILEKFLDTSFRGPIRFRQKVLMVFFETPLELFSLERKGRPVAGRPFRLFLSRSSASLHTAGELRLVNSADAPGAAGSPQVWARP